MDMHYEYDNAFLTLNFLLFLLFCSKR